MNMNKIMLPTKWTLIKRLKHKRVLDIGGVGYSCCDKLPRQKLFRDAWSGIKRTTMDINPEADIVVDLNKLPLPKIKGNFDVAVLFDILEHIKYPALVLEWLPAKECWINVPVITPWTSILEKKYEKIIPGFHHLCGWNILHAENFINQCGWRIMEKGYSFDYQSWKGKIFSLLVASRFPCLMGMGIFFRCVR